MDPKYVIQRVESNKAKTAQTDMEAETTRMKIWTELVEQEIRTWDSSEYDLEIQHASFEFLTKEKLLTILQSINQKFELTRANRKYCYVNTNNVYCGFVIGLRGVHYKLRFYVKHTSCAHLFLQTFFNFPEDREACVHTFDTWEAREAYIQKIEPIKGKKCIAPDGTLLVGVTRYERCVELYTVEIHK